MLGAQFIATSMIARAGIIMRNSVLRIGFVDLALVRGQRPGEAVVETAMLRTKTIALTALAAMTGGFFIHCRYCNSCSTKA